MHKNGQNLSAKKAQNDRQHHFFRFSPSHYFLLPPPSPRSPHNPIQPTKGSPMRLTGSVMLLWVLRSRSVFAFSLQRSRHAFLNCHKTRFHSSSRLSSTDNDVQPEPMANLYTGWSIEDDQILFKNRKKSLPDLALLLGRGLRGVGSRLDKLTDVNSQAYARLFAGRRKPEEDENDEKNINNKLIPAIEVLRRIRWDYALTTSDFTVLHYDRIEDATTDASICRLKARKRCSSWPFQNTE